MHSEHPFYLSHLCRHRLSSSSLCPISRPSSDPSSSVNPCLSILLPRNSTLRTDCLCQSFGLSICKVLVVKGRTRTVKWRNAQGKVWECPRCGASVSSPHRVRAHHPRHIAVFTNQEVPLSQNFYSHDSLWRDKLNHWPHG